MNKTRALHKKIIKEYKDATLFEIWEGIRDNFNFIHRVLIHSIK